MIITVTDTLESQNNSNGGGGTVSVGSSSWESVLHNILPTHKDVSWGPEEEATNSRELRWGRLQGGNSTGHGSQSPLVAVCGTLPLEWNWGSLCRPKFKQTQRKPQYAKTEKDNRPLKAHIWTNRLDGRYLYTDAHTGTEKKNRGQYSQREEV